MSDKIYCIDCPFYFQLPQGDTCAAYDNMVDTYKAPKSNPIESPGIINRNNDCQWFETKESFLKRTMEVTKKEKTWWQKVKDILL